MIKAAVIDRTLNPHIIGPAIPVEIMTAAQAGGMPIEAKSIRVVRAKDSDIAAGLYKVAGQRPIPMIVVPEGIDSIGGPVQPVYVVSGVLDVFEYTNKMLALGPIQYLTQTDLSGSVALDSSPFARNGAYTGVTLGQAGIGDGLTSAGFDGATSFDNAFSASLAAAFSGAQGSFVTWGAVANPGVWLDGVTRRIILFQVDANNRIGINKSASNNEVDWLMVAGGVSKSGGITSFNPLGFFSAGLTWDKANDQVKFYINGTQSGPTLTGLGVFAGSLSATQTIIGSLSTAAAQVWNGSLAHLATFNRTLSASEMLSSATRVTP